MSPVILCADRPADADRVAALLVDMGVHLPDGAEGPLMAFAAGRVNARQFRDGIMYVADEQQGPWFISHEVVPACLPNLISVFPGAHYVWLPAGATGGPLAMRRGALKIDMSGDWSDSELRELLEGYLQARGVL